MIFKFCWPDHPDRGDVFVEGSFVSLKPNDSGLIVIMVEGKPVFLEADGLRVYLLDANGNTIDKPKVGGVV